MSALTPVCEDCAIKNILIGEIDSHSIEDNAVVFRLFLAHVEDFIADFERHTFERARLFEIVTNFVKQRVEPDKALGITKKDEEELCKQLFEILIAREALKPLIS